MLEPKLESKSNSYYVTSTLVSSDSLENRKKRVSTVVEFIFY